MKIAWLNEHLLQFNGGVRFIYEVTKRLVKNNDVQIYATDTSDSNRDLFKNINVNIISYSTIINASNLKYWLFYPYYLRKHASLLKRHLKEYDTVISTSPTTNILCLLANIRPVIICFESNPWLYNNEYIKGLFRLKQVIVRTGKFFISHLEKKSFKNAKAVICHSKFVQSEIRRIYNVDSVVIPVGVDTKKFSNNKDFDIPSIYNNTNVILHVASYLSPMKGTRYAIEAMKWIVNQVPNAILLIITQDTKEAQDKLLQKYAFSISKSYNFSEHIKFITNATDNDIITYYSFAKVLLQPSLDENAHYPAIEAGCCECPTVGFNGKFECEDIVNNITGYTVEKYNSKELAVITVSILKNHSIQSYLGKNAKQFMTNKFSWDKYISKLQDIINGN